MSLLDRFRREAEEELLEEERREQEAEAKRLAPEAPDAETEPPKAPVKQKPVKQKPVKKAPVKKAPAAGIPANELDEKASAEETPAEAEPDLFDGFTPDDESESGEPAAETPVEKVPAEEIPIEEAPIKEDPVEGTPIEETPAEEVPVEEAPAEDSSVEETPIEETPVEKNSAEAEPDLFDGFTPDDESENGDPAAAGSASDNSRRVKITKIIRTVVMSVCGVVFAVCLVLIAFNLYGKMMAGTVYDPSELGGSDLPGGLATLKKNGRPGTIRDLSSIENAGDDHPVIEPPIVVPDDPDEELRLELARKQTYIREKQKENPDIFGVIEVKDTHILYPVVRGTDNKFYLTHDAAKGFLSIGAIFLDYKTSIHLADNYNSVIYGHNINGGAMFHDVTLFSDSEFFRTHDVYIYTLDGLFVYRPFCYYKPKASSGYIQRSFVSGNEFAAFANSLASQSMTLTDYTFTGSDRIITLSTCLNMTTTSKYRYVLHAYLLRVVE